MLLIGTFACSRSGEEPIGKQTTAPQADETRQVQFDARPERLFTISEAPDGDTSLLLTLGWEAGWPLPEKAPKLAFCLPVKKGGQAQWANPILADKDAPAPDLEDFVWEQKASSSTQPRFKGITRRWAIWELTVPLELFDAIKDKPDNHKTLQLGLKIKWPASEVLETGGTPDANWQQLLERWIINPASLPDFQIAHPVLHPEIVLDATPPQALASEELKPGVPRPWGRLEISEPGLYRLTKEDLIRANFPFAEIHMDAVRVFSRGEPVALWEPARGSAWESGVYFRAWASESPYTTTRVYWITLGEDLPSTALTDDEAIEGRITAAFPTRTFERHYRHERDVELVKELGNFLNIRNMAWIEAGFTADKPLSLLLDLPGYVRKEGDVDAQLKFFINPQYEFRQNRMQCDLIREPNGASKPIQTLSFHTHHSTEQSLTLPANLMNDAVTTLALSIRSTTPGSAAAPAGLWFDYADFKYPSRAVFAGGQMLVEPIQVGTRDHWLQIDDAQRTAFESALGLRIDSQQQQVLNRVHPVEHPRRKGQFGLLLESGNGLAQEWYQPAASRGVPPVTRVASPLTLPEEPAAMCIVTHREFKDAAERLAAFHRERGEPTFVVDVQSIFDRFSHGDLTPLALRDWLAWGLEQPGMPATILLMGDCSSDYRNVAQSDVRNFIPSYTFDTGGDRWASDVWMTFVAGSDDLTDYVLARLSVASREDAAQVVDNLIDYATQEEAGPWRGRLGYVADDGEFTDAIDRQRNEWTPPGYATRRVALAELPFEDNFYLPPEVVEARQMKVCPRATQGILDMLRDGVAFLAYYGHGSPNIWAEERIWFGGDSSNSDNLFLADSGRYTFLANMTCNAGAIDYPMRPWNVCITEDMMRMPHGGAIGCFVPSGPGVTQNHLRLGGQLRRVLFEDNVRRQGEVAALTRLRYCFEDYPRDMLFMYALLGDPLLALQFPTHNGQLTDDAPLKLGRSGSERVIAFTGLSPASGEVHAELEHGSPLQSVKLGTYAYQNGTLSLPLTAPSDPPVGEGTLKLYGGDGTEDYIIGHPVSWGPKRLGWDRIEFSVRHDPTRSKVGWEVTPPPTGGKWDSDFALSLSDGTSSRTLLGPEVVDDGRLSVSHDSIASLPAVLSARLSEAWPPEDLSAPAWREQTVAMILPPAPWTGFVPAATRLRQSRARQRGELQFTVASTAQPEKPLRVKLVATRAAMNKKQELKFEERAEQFEATGSFELTPIDFINLEGAELHLLSVEDAATSMTPALEVVIDRLPIDALPRESSLLRIVPGSLRLEPPNPTDGETCFVHLEIENSGTEPVPTVLAGLYDAPPADGGKLVANYVQYGQTRLRDLGPGRRVPLSLRYDPFDNAGEETLWVHITSGPGDEERYEPHRLQTITLNVRTKYDLELREVSKEASATDLADRRMTLRVPLENIGETNALNVFVGFYRGEECREDQLITELQVDRVDALTTFTVEYEWHFDPEEDLPLGYDAFEPAAQAWFRGSLQRITSLDQTRKEEE